MNLAHKHELPQAEVVQFPKQERQPMSKDKFDKGYVMVSRLYLNEVRPFLSRAAKDVYEELNSRITGFNKSTDFVSYSQLQGGKLEGSNKLGRASVSSGLKELIDLGVITIISENKKKGNEYQINEVSLVERFRNKTSSETKLVQLVNQDSSASELLGSSATEHTIDIIYRYLNIDKSIYVHFANAPLVANLLTFKKRKKIADAQNIQKQFDLFWSAYPLKKNRKGAEAKFKAIDFKKNSFDQIMASLEKHKMSFDWTKDEGKYIPHPTTWINGERWNDEVRQQSFVKPQLQKQSRDDAWAEYYRNRENKNPQFVDVQGVTHD